MAIDWNEWDAEGSFTHSKTGDATTAICGIDARERHKLAERERRKSMRELFLSLHALLPHSNTVRKEQSAILDEIIKYIPSAAARLRSLQNRKKSHSSTSSRISQSSTPPVQGLDRHSASADSSEFDIRVEAEISSCVSIRIRGDRVNVSLTDTNSKGTSQVLPLSAILDELEAHHLEIVRSTHCRDGSKILHHTECKICDGLDRSPPLLKARLEQLAGKLHWLRKSSSSPKRKFDQLD
ncbi:protein IRON-RELATED TRANSCRIPTION FACTOR 2-like [Macadamia integrifolia]|uniref:protein IRON-RELATED TRANSCRIPTION FACTOR 2-like n=1 Tax=Macadamia integrifolia TaxID=60698 RepID=UPI001C4FF24D|nr:protein IRON-RELATED TRANSCRIPTION FACTOR 2-like [Macadamia integrifolia]